MKIILLLILHTIAMNAFAQLNPVPSGVIHWADLPVKKDNDRESRKLAEGSTNEFEYFEIHATTQQKGSVATPPTRKKI